MSIIDEDAASGPPGACSNPSCPAQDSRAGQGGDSAGAAHRRRISGPGCFEASMSSATSGSRFDVWRLDSTRIAGIFAPETLEPADSVPPWVTAAVESGDLAEYHSIEGSGAILGRHRLVCGDYLLYALDSPLARPFALARGAFAQLFGPLPVETPHTTIGTRARADMIKAFRCGDDLVYHSADHRNHDRSIAPTAVRTILHALKQLDEISSVSNALVAACEERIGMREAWNSLRFVFVLSAEVSSPDGTSTDKLRDALARYPKGDGWLYRMDSDGVSRPAIDRSALEAVALHGIELLEAARVVDARDYPEPEPDVEDPDLRRLAAALPGWFQPVGGDSLPLMSPG